MKFEELTAEVEKHNHILERTYQLEADMAVTRNDIEALYREVVNLNPPQIRWINPDSIDTFYAALGRPSSAGQSAPSNSAGLR